MPDLRSQLRWYYQSLIRLRDPGDVIAGRAGGVTVIQEREASAARRWWRQPAVVATTAALLAFALFGGGALLGLHLGSGNDATVEPTTTTTLPATTTMNPQVAGLVWARVPDDDAAFGNSWMDSVVVGGPGLVAVGLGTYEPVTPVWTSTDGLTWERVPHDEAVFRNSRILSVAVGGPGLVAVGSVNASTDHPVPHAAVWTSTDGLIWEAVPDNAAAFGSNSSINSVVVGGPGLVAVGADGSGAMVWTSTDGLIWEAVADNDAAFGNCWMNSVMVGGPGLVAVGIVDASTDHPVPHAAVWTSTDGLTWERVPHDEAVFGSNSRIFSVAVGGPGLVAVGIDDSGATVWTSTDGLTWERAPVNGDVFADPAGPSRIISVVAGGPGLVAVGCVGVVVTAAEWTSTAAAWTSTDGLTWQRVPHNEDIFGGVGCMASVVVRGSGLVAVGYGNGRINPGPGWLAGALESDAAVWVSPPPG